MLCGLFLVGKRSCGRPFAKFVCANLKVSSFLFCPGNLIEIYLMHYYNFSNLLTKLILGELSVSSPNRFCSLVSAHCPTRHMTLLKQLEKNPAYGRHRISLPMQIVAPIIWFLLASKKGLIAIFCYCNLQKPLKTTDKSYQKKNFVQ